MMETLAEIERRTFSGMIEVRASALLYLIGMLDGFLKGEADTDAIVALLIGQEKEASDVR